MKMGDESTVLITLPLSQFFFFLLVCFIASIYSYYFSSSSSSSLSSFFYFFIVIFLLFFPPLFLFPKKGYLDESLLCKLLVNFRAIQDALGPKGIV